MDWFMILKWFCIVAAALALLGGLVYATLAWFLNHAD
jgi:hypothetical protein